MAGKRVLLTAVSSVVLFLLWDRFSHDDPSERLLLRPDFSQDFLLWVQSHPALGIGALLVVIAGGVIPRQDYDYLYEAGVKCVFGPGTTILDSARSVLQAIGEARAD